MEMAGSCAKNGAHSAWKNCTDMDSRGLKEKGASTNNMESRLRICDPPHQEFDAR